MGRTIFKYTKTIIKKVSFDRDLLSKEIAKANDRLLPFELNELQIWFKKEYPDNNLINEINN